MLKRQLKSSLRKHLEQKYNAEVTTANRAMWRGEQRCHVATLLATDSHYTAEVGE
jgi:hypothetical protein